jgi:hypothetical protein
MLNEPVYVGDTGFLARAERSEGIPVVRIYRLQDNQWYRHKVFMSAEQALTTMNRDIQREVRK